MSDDPARAANAATIRRLITELVLADPDQHATTEVGELLERALVLLAAQPRMEVFTDPARAIAEANRTAARRGPMIGQLNPLAPPMDVSSVDGVVTALVTYGPAYEGPPNCVHGGVIAGGFDEVLGICQGLTPRPGVTATLDVKYRSTTPLLQPVRYSAKVERIEGRKIFVSGDLRLAADDRLCATADGMFVAIDIERFLQL